MKVRLFLFLLFTGFLGCKTQEVKATIQGDTQGITKNEENVAKERNERAYLGILYIETHHGVQIVEVFPDSPASKAGLEPGDVILSANGNPVMGSYTLRENIFSKLPGTIITIEVEKLDGKKKTLKAVLEPLPEKYLQFYR